VRRRPYCVILLDEIEKAHADVFNVLLQLLDDGRLTDGHGRTVDFRNVVVIMTSNMGSHLFREHAQPDKLRPLLMQELRNTLRPEFLNRIDEVVVFHALDEKHIAGIAKIQLSYLEKRLAQLEMGLVVEDSALAELAQAGFDPVFGARPLKRAIQQQIENPLAKAILEGKFAAKDTIRVSCDPATGGIMRFVKV
jgi:ATP-dependent Clp protease ATP-binding subunit ClpB